MHGAAYLQSAFPLMQTLPLVCRGQRKKEEEEEEDMSWSQALQVLGLC